MEGTVNDMMFEMALVAQNWAVAMQATGYTAGRAPGFGQADWLYIDTPAGQVGFAIKDAHWVAEFPPYEEPWDGHTWEEKLRRMAVLLQGPEDLDEGAS